MATSVPSAQDMVSALDLDSDPHGLDCVGLIVEASPVLPCLAAAPIRLSDYGKTL